MRRRSFLATGALALGFPVAGCLGDSGTDDNEEETTTPAADIDVVLYNGTEGTLDVSVAVRTDEGETLAEDDLTLAADERREIPSRISETGDYEIHLTVGEDREQTFSTTIEEYDLSAGSNHILEIGESEIEMLVEE